MPGLIAGNATYMVLFFSRQMLYETDSETVFKWFHFRKTANISFFQLKGTKSNWIVTKILTDLRQVYTEKKRLFSVLLLITKSPKPGEARFQFALTKTFHRNFLRNKVTRSGIVRDVCGFPLNTALKRFPRVL